jgi:hypothetical protein
MHCESSVMWVIIPAYFVYYCGLWPQSYHRGRDYRTSPLVHLNTTFELCASGQQIFVFSGTRSLFHHGWSIFHFLISSRQIPIATLSRESGLYKCSISNRFLYWIFFTYGVFHDLLCSSAFLNSYSVKSKTTKPFMFFFSASPFVETPQSQTFNMT